MRKYKISILTVLFALAGLVSCGKDNSGATPGPGTGPGTGPEPGPSDYDLVNFPKGSEPKVVGVKLAERFIEVPHSFWGNITSSSLDKVTHITYPDVCAWLGALWFAEQVKNDDLWDRLANKFDLLFTTEKHLQPDLATKADNKVDYYVFGAIPLNIYQKRKDAKYLDLGLKYADGQYTLPANATTEQKKWHDKGYSWQTRLWIDDMFMITALQAQAFLATGNEKYIERAAKGMVLYLEELQRANGLFYHAPNAPFYWARGDGWMAVGMPEILKILPTDAKYDTYRTKIMAGYKKMMEGLLRNQAYDGVWSQLIDDTSMWRETSGSAMFTYGMLLGVKYGWLDEKTYGAAARKAWIQLQTYLTANYDLREVCEGTGAGTSAKYYKDRRRWIGDTHGQAGMLWSAFALASIADDKEK